MKKILFVLSILFLASLSYGLYQYFKPSANIKKIAPKFSISAHDLRKQLVGDNQAVEKFGNTVFMVEGAITSVDKANTTTVLIDSSVRCELDKNAKLNQEEGKIRIKGLLGGYDEFFDEVLMIKCEVEEKKKQRNKRIKK